MGNINDSFFAGYYKTIWKNFIPEELTQREINFMIPYFNLGPGSRVLDLMCGYGRHAIGLGREGIAVTAVDNLADYVEEINEVVKKEGLPVRAINRDILGFEPEEEFDLAICMGNSFQFFERKELHSILSILADCLKPGGQLLINSWSIAEIAIRNFKERTSSQVGEMKLEAEHRFLLSPSRIEVKSTIITPEGEREERNSVDYIYSLNEMEEMLRGVGFALKEVYSIPGKKKFTIGEPRAYIVAQKI